ncbi:citryl-CoA lyase, partial [Halococcus thailandensis JCM 13552]
TVGSDERHLDEEELSEELLDMVEYVPSMDDIVDSMEQFEEARDAGTGAIAMERAATIEIDGISVDVSNDRMWDEATYQASMTPVSLFQDVYEHRPDQHDDLEELYSPDVVERATDVGN